MGRARAKPTIVKNLRPDLRFNELVGFDPLYPPYKKNAFMLNLMALTCRVAIVFQINNFTKGNHKGLPLQANIVGAIPCGCPDLSEHL
ncbi:hypothetical protein PN36_28560 [Candidatus Thiomargarita nelsonii]|uniref:Uncharacterized protein n=1 Tax=Candidatus Thiomargarita nelsonii TaxID=1003181 RepID=A0A4E0QLL8_9GAMM|nr:hypothetical protein PN36_28560 [Candidatus Thiomargarita nelsonii]